MPNLVCLLGIIGTFSPWVLSCDLETLKSVQSGDDQRRFLGPVYRLYEPTGRGGLGILRTKS